jgi:signal transduction histidine kinase
MSHRPRLRERFATLNTSLAVIGAATLVALMGGFAVSSFLIEQNNIRQTLVSVADEMSGRLGLSLARPMWNYEYPTVQLAIQVDARSADVSWIILRDADGVIQAGIIKGADGAMATQPADIEAARAGIRPAYRTERKLEYQGEGIGTIEVAVSDTQRQADFTSRVLSTILAQLAISLATLGAVVVWVRLFIIRRLAQLQKVVSKFGGQGFGIRAPEGRMDEIGRLARQFNAMAGTIHAYSTEMEDLVKERTVQLVESEKLAFLGSLVAGIAHEINTPVGVCLTAITYMENRIQEVHRQYRDGGLSKAGFDGFLDELKRSSEMIVSNLNRTSELVRTFRGIGADQLKDDCRVFNLGDYLREVIFSLSPKLRKLAHEVGVDCPPDINVRSYPSALYQVVSNLVVNSITHGFDDGRKGRIEISVCQYPDHLALVYSDNGRGIPADSLPQIFNPFYTTKRGQGGTGLGLYIAYTLINKLHGSISCASEPGAGAVFTIKLPLDIIAGG